jgi:hypothetical protein
MSFILLSVFHGCGIDGKNMQGMGIIQFIGKFIYTYPGFNCCKIHNVEASNLQQRTIRLTLRVTVIS